MQRMPKYMKIMSFGKTQHVHVWLGMFKLNASKLNKMLL